tara:strand:- start:48 stop:272 length:225 start_codon:yes stop_codon:yes gene_type:complete
MRAKIIEAIKQHAKGQLEKHKTNVEVQLTNPVGVASHPDHIETINKELKSMAQYDEQLEMIEKYFEYKDPLKSK